MLVEIYESQAQDNLDYYNLSKCQFFLDVPESTSLLLSKLLEDDDNQLVAYQIGFDLVESENQAFLLAVNQGLKCDNYHRVERLGKILQNEVPRQLSLQFLKKNNYFDINLIKGMKEKIDDRKSIPHGMCVWANGFMNAMTTNDSFL